MSVQADLKWIHEELDKVNDPLFIEAIKNMLKYNKKVSSQRISIEEYNKELDTSIAQIESGQTFTDEQMRERIKKWGEQ
ncbi:hypothetical protein [Leeuwenhoekiella parthenopeia]|uniref:Addiction module component n=1 Tax=Leeuwenhoekiella parthenopeia TaxID=2890320 RepID=A0ABS8GR42_9FLAO|nr:hypothetical protein [Leeuwenhoekiella parthenopeia]MCC4212261.1 hypothetical protein [Leeuwenhoekiella parthenopeia]